MTRHLALALLLLAGCGTSGSQLNSTDDAGVVPDGASPADLAGGGGGGDMAVVRPALGKAIDAPKGTWTWVDFPESQCHDGSATGIGVNPGTSTNVVVYMNGGGACWDYQTCFVLRTAALGPYGATQFNQQTAGLPAGTIFDRGDPANPFKDWSFVFVPYCTGDLHGGDNVASYMNNGTTMQFHHKGRANLEAEVPRIAGTWPSPGKLVVTGSSAGGYGAAINYDLFRRYWPTGASYMLDDSGPPLLPDDAPALAGFVKSWYTSWNLGKAIDPLCPDCMNDLSQLATATSRKYPNDRMALLSSEQDQTIRGYALLSANGFQTALNNMATTVLDPLANYRYFFVAGQTHTMLGAPAGFSQQGTSLKTWITQMVNDDAGWKTLKP